MRPNLYSLFLTIAPVGAQVMPTEDRGPFQAMAHVLMTDSPGLPGLRFKQANDISALPAVSATSGYPSYVHADLFRHYTPGQQAEIIIDAISSGNDEIPALPGGVLDPGSEGWVHITFSVGADPTGIPLIDTRHASSRGDLYGHYLSNSVGVPSELVGQTWLQQAPEHMGMPIGTNLTAHDIQMAHIQNGAPAQHGFITVTNRIFFSLTSASAANCKNIFPALDVSSGRTTPSGADIFAMDWTPGPQGGWSEPYVYRAAEELVHSADYDVDALAVDIYDNAGNQTAEDILLISLKASPSITHYLPVNAQLLVQTKSTERARIPRYIDNSEIRLVITGEVDAIAVIDPDGAQGNTHVAYPYWVQNQPSAHLALSIANQGPLGTPSGTHGVSIDGFRGSWPPGLVHLESNLSGSWTSLGSVNRAAGAETVQFRLPIRWTGRLNLRARFSFNNTNHYSWPVYLQN